MILWVRVYYNVTRFFVIYRGNGLIISHSKIRQQIEQSSYQVLCHILNFQRTENSTIDYCVNSDSSFVDGIFLGAITFSSALCIHIGLIFWNRRIMLTLFCTISIFMGFMLNFIKSHMLQLLALVHFMVLVNSCVPIVFSAVANILPTHLRCVKTP